MVKIKKVLRQYVWFQEKSLECISVWYNGITYLRIFLHEGELEQCNDHSVL